MPMQKFYAALLFGLLFFLPGNSLLAQETITSTGNYIDFSGSGFAAVPAIYPPPSTNNELTFSLGCILTTLKIAIGIFSIILPMVGVYCNKMVS